MIQIGFTGTRKGCNDLQLQAIKLLLVALGPLDITAHHGGCIGADLQFHHALLNAGVGTINVYPSSSKEYAAKLPEAPGGIGVVLHPEKPPLERNRDIILASDLIVAAPFELDEQQRGGTWSTWRLANAKGKSTILVPPNAKCRVRASSRDRALQIRIVRLMHELQSAVEKT